MIAAQTQRDASLAASRVFRGLRPEVERAVRKFDAAQNEKLEAIIDAWGRFECKIKLDEDYSAACSIARGLAYSAAEVEAFSVALSASINGNAFKAGVFMSALINTCADNDFIIHTRHHEEPIIVFGYQNIKNIIVEGDLGLAAAFLMEGGSITVEGDAGAQAGEMMTGGCLLIRGDCGDSLGRVMRGGRIIIWGNPNYDIGDSMWDGEIRLEGDAGKLGEIYGGRIFHQGVLIIDRPDVKVDD